MEIIGGIGVKKLCSRGRVKVPDSDMAANACVSVRRSF